MTSPNLGATENLFRIWNARDFEALVPLVTEDVEWVPATMAAVEGGSFSGREGMRRFFDEWDQAWKLWEVQPQEVRDLGSRVLVLGRVHAEARGSGLTLDQEVAYLFEFRDGLLARGATFFSHDEANAAAAGRDQGDEGGIAA